MATTQTAPMHATAAAHPAAPHSTHAQRPNVGYFDMIAGLALAQKRERQRQQQDS
ncbi:hypothetical protein [Bacterioplanes sanyensis]|uniref:hypothetical protein n=1 Tax=Bacterioplanes sanyensis TaxID=1249553 RepID=UPI0012FE02E5|nr:hypothetical protein [Bacterioplanes sanyensis]